MKNILLILLSHLKTPKYWIKNILWRFPKTISESQIYFVMGTPRSGTTLLQKILESHSKLFSIHGETAIFSYQNFWDNNRKHFELSKSEIKELLSISSDNVNFFENGVNNLLNNNPGKIFIEKTPQHIKHLDFLIRHFPKAKFIHIVRDGRDCYCSARKHPWIPQSKSISTFSKYYNRCLSQGIKSFSNPNVYTLKYENLVRDPKNVLVKLMEFLNLELEEEQLDSAFRSKDNRAQLEQFKKLNEGINDSSVGRWRKELNEYEINQFNKHSIEVLKFFEYE